MKIEQKKFFSKNRIREKKIALFKEKCGYVNDKKNILKEQKKVKNEIQKCLNNNNLIYEHSAKTENELVDYIGSLNIRLYMNAHKNEKEINNKDEENI